MRYLILLKRQQYKAKVVRKTETYRSFSLPLDTTVTPARSGPHVSGDNDCGKGDKLLFHSFLRHMLFGF